MSMDTKRNLMFKFLVIGEPYTGKTALVRRYVQNLFPEMYRPSRYSFDFRLKLIQYDDNTLIRLLLWNIASQQQLDTMTVPFYTQAVACLIVFDITRDSTFEAVTKWKTELDNKVQLPNGNPVPCVLVANKCDRAEEGLINNPEYIDQFCCEKGFVGWFATSAKENINVEKPFKCLINEIMKTSHEFQSLLAINTLSKSTINVTDTSVSENNNSSCCYGSSSTN